MSKARLYTVIEQYPYREIATFQTWEDAFQYISLHKLSLAMPIIVSREVK
jgi:hypothetical protein